MKNKEIEKLLNRLKDNNDWYVIENKEEHNTEPYKLLLPTERNLLLSYIEQLENRNKELYEGFMATQEELTDYATKNEQLENNRDKAIEYIDNYLEREYFNYDILETNTIYNRDLFKVKNILKGDGDE